ncbi:hypothetical protein BpHYR1_007062 [Brachionus plicatilis]|uniref:Uncharacterized protein n=1 Tax=Brachionus plicatilis TaxID=10195 RepID=A0A3M7PBX4_BRAPC|nr:hypothetical protein BpHYR1_007062 [Brachionus plicatilis]
MSSTSDSCVPTYYIERCKRNRRASLILITNKILSCVIHLYKIGTMAIYLVMIYSKISDVINID